MIVIENIEDELTDKENDEQTEAKLSHISTTETEEAAEATTTTLHNKEDAMIMDQDEEGLIQGEEGNNSVMMQVKRIEARSALKEALATPKTHDPLTTYKYLW